MSLFAKKCDDDDDGGGGGDDDDQRDSLLTHLLSIVMRTILLTWSIY